MRERIEHFAKGEFEYEIPLLSLSVEEIRITAETGKTLAGTFSICNSLGRPMKGVIYSTHRQIRLEEPNFFGTDCLITYSILGAELKAGEEIQGVFTIVSDCGEQEIPFFIQVEQTCYKTQLGKTKDLFQFAGLARTDPAEAKRVFRDEDFERIFLTNEDRFRSTYRGLLGATFASQAMEEFLIAVHKKQAVRLHIDKTYAQHLVLDESLNAQLVLTREHWGYTEIRISTDVPFIQLEQKILWADRFDGDTHPIAYTIDPNMVGKGKHYGHIWIKTVYQTLVITICCSRNAEHGNSLSSRRLAQRLEFGLIDNYLSFRLNRIDVIHFLEEAEGMIKELPSFVKSSVRELLKIHLAIICGKNSLAEELLKDFDEVKERLKNQSCLEYCGYLYLRALCNKDEITVKNTAARIRNIYENECFDWRILWFLLYTDQRYEKNNTLKLTDIKAQYEAGCRSPILYYEAVCIYNEEPFLLRELSDFEIQVIYFGIKYWFLSKEVIQQYTYLAGKRKTFHPVIYQGLEKLYEEYETNDILSAICCLLIKGMKKSEKYFLWYQRGVETQLRVTELYEYYMYSVSCDRQEPLAPSVILYFIYNNSSLSDRKKAFLFANIIRYKEKNASIFRTYLKKMEVFASKMLEAHIINWDLAVLYKEFFQSNLLSAELLKHLPFVIYRHELNCDNPYITSVIVIHKELGTMDTVPLTNGCAQLNIFTGNAEIFLIDQGGNRYVNSIDYKVTPYLNSEEYEIRCLEYSTNTMLLLHLFYRYQNYRVMSEAAIAIRKQILQLEGITPEYITLCYQSLIEYYYENNHDDLLEFFLNQIDLSKVRPSERSKYIEYMIIRAYYNMALRTLETYGFEEVNLNRLVKFCSGFMLTPEAEQKREIMVVLCYYVFSQNKYDESILRYLVKFFNGTKKEMLQLWQAARNFELNTNALEERILMHLLFTQCAPEESFRIFVEYYKNATNHILIRALLSYYAYQYLIHDLAIWPELFLIMKRELNYEENELCLIAWLKFQRNNHDQTETELLFIEYHINRFVNNGWVLPFFIDYKDKISLPKKMLNKYYITYVANPERQVFLHYRLRNKEQNNEITERMPNIFMGLHVKEFMLFYHEVLQYYITEEYQEQSISTEEIEVTYDCEVLEEVDTKYNQINQMLMALETQDEETLLNRMEDYCKKEYIISSCFGQIK